MSEKEQEVTITEQDIQALTPQHRIVWHQPPGEPVEMGLYVDEDGFLCTDVGPFVRYGDGSVPTLVLRRIVRIIPPAFVPRVGMVIGKPGSTERMSVCVEEGDWLGHAPEISNAGHWFGDTNARILIENHGWEVMGDLAAPGEVTEAEVVAAAAVLRARAGHVVRNPELEARAALEAAREARNG